MNNIPDSFCILPWKHICIKTNNRLSPCCRFRENTDTSLDSLGQNGISAMNTPFWIKLREDMLNGVHRNGCVKCQAEERSGSGKNSMRNISNKYFAEALDISTLGTKFDKLEFLEFAIDNLCNLQCRMCDSKFSSKLQMRDRFLGNIVHKKLEPSFSKLDNIDLTHLKRVKLLGGEVFMSPNFIKFIDYLNERSNIENIELSIHTNGTLLPNKEVIDKMNMFRSLQIVVSLDSYDESNDYQRVGGSYIETFKNAQIYMQIFKNANVKFHSVISILNVNKFSNTVDIIRESYGFGLSYDYVRDPKYLSLLYAPEEVLDFILESNRSNKTAYDSITNFIKESKYDRIIWNELENKLNSLDKYHNMKFEDYNKPMSNIIRDSFLKYNL